MDIKSCQAIILLNELITKGRTIRIMLNGDDDLLRPLFTDMYAKAYVTIVGDHYVATQSGKTAFETFMKRYNEYLKVYDIYSKVDMEAGEFAFTKIFDYEYDENGYSAEWEAFKNEERFFDVRVAVANFKKMDAFEIVFMSFINENRFDTSVTGWQFDMLSAKTWAEISNICATAIQVSDIVEKYGEESLINMINLGTELMLSLIQKEIDMKKVELAEAQLASAGNEEDEYITTTTTYIEEYEDDLVYYDSYWDPYYYSPIWVLPLFYW